MIDYVDSAPMIVNQLTPGALRRASEVITRLIARAGRQGDCALMGVARE